MLVSKKGNSVFEAVELEEYRYQLPEERIAKHPLSKRENSKLLVYKNNNIAHQHFFELPGLLPADSLLVFNNTKVIPARLQFRKETGAIIEIFLLQPLSPSPDLQLAMVATGNATWRCMIGNRKRWKSDIPLQHTFSVKGESVQLEARLVEENGSDISFRWSPANITFAELVEAAGEIPLPPYLKRKAEQEDKERYQTVYSSLKGAVAAPTAGLHFTPAILEQLQRQGVKLDQLTLHVGAGTFQPIKENNVALHPMHREQVVIRASNIVQLLNHNGPIIAVGTTSMRSLESVYWYGAKLLNTPDAPFFITKEECYEYTLEQIPSPKEALAAVLKKLQTMPDQQLVGETEIFIVPGYQFKICKGLITNFHQPESTLMLLVAAFIGPDWKSVYNEALLQGYRFLSYGDSSLLLPGTSPKP